MGQWHIAAIAHLNRNRFSIEGINTILLVEEVLQSFFLIASIAWQRVQLEGARARFAEKVT